MNLVSNIIFNTYSIAMLLIIYFHALKLFDRELLSVRLNMSILQITIFMLIVDILSRFDGNASTVIYPVLNHIGNFVIFMMSPVLTSLWVAYVHYQVFRDERRVKKLRLPLCIIIAMNAAGVILSQFFGWYYYIDSDNIFHRGPLYPVPVFI